MINPFDPILDKLDKLDLQLQALHTKQDPPAEIIDRKELQRRLAITEPTAIFWGRKGIIPEIRIGSNIRYNWASVVQALERTAEKYVKGKREINMAKEKRDIAVTSHNTK